MTFTRKKRNSNADFEFIRRMLLSCIFSLKFCVLLLHSVLDVCETKQTFELFVYFLL